MNQKIRTIILSLLSFMIVNSNLNGQTVFDYNNGSPNWVNLGDLDIPGDQITVESLIWADAITGGNIVSKHTHRTNVNYLLRAITFEITTYNKDSTTTNFLQMWNPYKLKTNTWYHVAGTYDGKRAKYYVNGCLVIDTPFTGNLFINNLDCAIGNISQNHLNEQFEGKLDEVRIWKVCRTETELKNNMYDLSNPTTQNGLMAYYKFEGDFINSQGNSTYDGKQVGRPKLTKESVIIKPLQLDSFHTTGSCSTGSLDLVLFANKADIEYSLNGVTYQKSNIFKNLSPKQYILYLRNPEGCYMDTTITLTFKSNIFVNKDAFMCIDDKYQLPKGQFTTKSGVYLDTFKTKEGCDSIIRTNLSFYKSIPDFSLGNDTTICIGNSIELNGPNGNYSYLWNNNSTGKSITANTSGLFILKIVDENKCSATDSLNVRISDLPKINLGNDSTICENSDMTLYGPTGNYQYLWNDGSNFKDLTVKKSGTYWLKITNEFNCSNTDTININTFEMPKINFGSDSLFCEDESVTLNGYHKDGTSYLWQDGSSNSNYKISNTGLYTLILGHKCGQTSKSINITFEDCKCYLFIPNAFTPNYDEHNDYYKINPCYKGKYYRMRVYSRWGELLFDTTDPNTLGWTGKFNDAESVVGMYLYLFEATDYRDKPYYHHGLFNLIK